MEKARHAKNKRSYFVLNSTPHCYEARQCTKSSYQLVGLMWQIAKQYEPERKNLYPEFFWLTLNSNLSSEMDYLYDFIYWLSDMGDRNTIRAYLTTLLLTEEFSREKLRQIVFSFYYTGHTVDSLKIITQVIPIQTDNLDLYELIYSHAMGMLFGERANTLTDIDKKFLETFFTHGLALSPSHPLIIESCQKAIAQLKELPESN